MLDSMGVFQHHDAITGSDAQFVAEDYVFKLQKSMDINNKVYKSIISDNMKKETGISTSELTTCLGASNNTVIECPIFDSRND